jgi:hydroxymethylbilane synthase
VTAALSLDEIVRTLGSTPRIGTSSVRRVAQLTRLFPGARFLPVRGNLGTRLRKLDGGDYDALVLASAGLRRLGREDRISASLPIDACVPAPGQGIIAIEIRGGDAAARAHVARIDDPTAAAALRAERTVVIRLGGGCQMPIGAIAETDGQTMTVTGVVVSPDGARAAHAAVSGPAAQAEAVGAAAADRLLEGGAGEILAEVQRTQAAVEGIQP